MEIVILFVLVVINCITQLAIKNVGWRYSISNVMLFLGTTIGVIWGINCKITRQSNKGFRTWKKVEIIGKDTVNVTFYSREIK